MCVRKRLPLDTLGSKGSVDLTAVLGELESSPHAGEEGANASYIGNDENATYISNEEGGTATYIRTEEGGNTAYISSEDGGNAAYIRLHEGDEEGELIMLPKGRTRMREVMHFVLYFL